MATAYIQCHVNTPHPILIYSVIYPFSLHIYTAQKVEAQIPYTGAIGLSPAQFYVHRDHTLGGSVSRLDRLRTHQELPYYMESFAEAEEEETGELEEREHIPCE